MRIRWPATKSPFAAAGLILIAVAFTVWGALFIRRTSFIAIDGRRYFSLFDDAMISMRYAWNLAHGLGAVWNPAQPVEGYTNPLMVLLMAVPSALMDKTNAVLAVQIGGLLTTLGTAGIASRVYLLVGPQNPPTGGGRVPWLVFLGVLAYYPLAYFTLMGMETGLLALLLTAMVYLAIQTSRRPRLRTFAALGATAGLAFLTRPDSVLFAVAVAAYIFLSRRGLASAKRVRWRAPLVGMVVFVSILVGQRLFAFTYYGSVLPNTFLLKIVGVPLPVKLLDGFRFIRPYLVQTFPFLLLCTAELVFDARPEKVLLGVIPVLAVAYQVSVGGDPWPFWRMMASSYPLLVVISVLALEAVAYALSGTGFADRYFFRRPMLPASALVPFLATLGLLPMIYLANRPLGMRSLAAIPPIKLATTTPTWMRRLQSVL